MNEQHTKIHEWLQDIYGVDSVPSYEITPRTLSVLHSLMLFNKEKNSSNNIIIEDLIQKTNEYTCEGHRIASVMKKVGLNEDALSQSGHDTLNSLSALCNVLEVKDTSNTSLLLSLKHTSDMKFKTMESRRKEQRHTADMFVHTRNALFKANALDKELKKLDEESKIEAPDLKKKAQNTTFFISKGKEYKNQIRKNQTKYNLVGVDPSIYHANLENKSEELKELQSRLNPLKTKLNSFHDLPPDLMLSKVKVEERRRQLASLEEELMKQIDFIHNK